MSAYVPERGYFVGVDLPFGERPFPNLWEQMPGLDKCPHSWESVKVSLYASAPEPVVRCQTCHVPRCGHSDDRDPCMERRHHGSVHITLHGSFEPVGGYLNEADR